MSEIIPIEIQLKLVEIPENIGDVLETIGKKLRSIGQVKVPEIKIPETKIPETKIPTEEIKQTTEVTKELDAINKDLIRTTTQLSPAFSTQAKDSYEASIMMGDLSKQTMNFINLLNTENQYTRQMTQAIKEGTIAIKEMGEGFQYSGTLAKEFEQAIRDGTVAISEIGGQLQITGQRATEFNKAIEAGKLSLTKVEAGYKITGKSAAYFEQQIKAGNIALYKVKDQFKIVSGEANRLAMAFDKGRMAIAKGRAGLVMTAGTFGSMGLAIRRLSRDFFWMGLGTMFITMAFARMRRNAFAMERQMYSLKTAYRAVQKSQRDVTKSLMEYGRGTEEAVLAQERYEDSLERVKVAEESVRASVEQHVYSVIMLAWGTLPTLIRGTWDLTTNLTSLAIAHTLAANAASWNAIASGASAGAQHGLGIAVWFANAGLAVQLAITAALTGGLILLTYALSQYMIQEQMKGVTKRMKEMREEFELGERSLVGSGLVGALETTITTLRILNKTGKEISLEKLRGEIESVSETKEISIEQEISQVIRQELILAEIPEVDSVTQSITQVLDEVNIEEPVALNQSITQILEEADIPEPRGLSQIIVQRLQEIEIPPVPEIQSQNVVIDVSLNDVDDEPLRRINVAVDNLSKSTLELNNILKENRNEFMGIQDELTGHSLVKSLNQTRNAYKELIGASTRFATGPGEMGRVGASVNVKNVNVGNIQVIASVRKDSDIKKIRASLEDLFVRGYFGRGGV